MPQLDDLSLTASSSFGHQPTSICLLASCLTGFWCFSNRALLNMDFSRGPYVSNTFQTTAKSIPGHQWKWKLHQMWAKENFTYTSHAQQRLSVVKPVIYLKESKQIRCRRDASNDSILADSREENKWMSSWQLSVPSMCNTNLAQFGTDQGEAKWRQRTQLFGAALRRISSQLTSNISVSANVKCTLTCEEANQGHICLYLRMFNGTVKY